MKVGDQAKQSKIITEDDIIRFSEIVGDKNPIHTDPEFAKNSMFGEQIAQGMLIGSLISGVLGTKLPGPGCVYLNQILNFLLPVKPGDYITAFVEVINIRNKADSSIVILKTWCTNKNNQTVVDGQAVMKTYSK